MTLNVKNTPAFGNFGQYPYANPYAYANPYGQSYGYDAMATQPYPQTYAPPAMAIAPTYTPPPAPQPMSFDMTPQPAPSAPTADQFTNLRSQPGFAPSAQPPTGPSPSAAVAPQMDQAALMNALAAAQQASPPTPSNEPSAMTPLTMPTEAPTKKGSPLFMGIKRVVAWFLGITGLVYWGGKLFGGGKSNGDAKLPLNLVENMNYVEFNRDDKNKIIDVESQDGKVYENKTLALKKDSAGKIVRNEVTLYQTAEGKPLDAKLDVYDTTQFDTPEKLVAEAKKREAEVLASL